MDAIAALTVLASVIDTVVFYKVTKRQTGILSQDVENQRHLSLDEMALSNYQTYFEYQMNKRRSALEFSLSMNPQARAAFDILNAHFGKLLFQNEKIPLAEMRKAIESNEIYTNVIIFLSHYERLATAIAADIADERAAFEFMGEPIVHYVTILYSFIEIRKGEHKHPRSYLYLEALVERWKLRLGPRGILEPYMFEKPDLVPPRLPIESVEFWKLGGRSR